MARQAPPTPGIDDAGAELVGEAARWRVERLAVGLRVTIEREDGGVVVHVGPRADVRLRCSIDSGDVALDTAASAARVIPKG